MSGMRISMRSVQNHKKVQCNSQISILSDSAAPSFRTAVQSGLHFSVSELSAQNRKSE